ILYWTSIVTIHRVAALATCWLATFRFGCFIGRHHRVPRSHHRQMVDDQEATSTEEIHRVAAVAT
ncbi:MAG: hypothetical protein ACK44Q_17130, partial [Pirellulaceae bacterium]